MISEEVTTVPYASDWSMSPEKPEKAFFGGRGSTIEDLRKSYELYGGRVNAMICAGDFGKARQLILEAEKDHRNGIDINTFEDYNLEDLGIAGGKEIAFLQDVLGVNTIKEFVHIGVDPILDAGLTPTSYNRILRAIVEEGNRRDKRRIEIEEGLFSAPLYP